MAHINIPIRYLPSKLSKRDKSKQKKMLLKSRKLYKNKKYYTRKPLASYKNKKSNHIINAQKIYGIKNVTLVMNKDAVNNTAGVKLDINKPIVGILFTGEKKKK